MTDINKYIDSGILELYVLGQCSAPEIEEIEQLAVSYPEIKEELDQISASLEAYAMARPVAPDPTLKPFLLATVDYTQRLISGEIPGFPPELNVASKIEDYSDWVNRDDMKIPENFTDFSAKIIGYTAQMTTAIVWISQMAPQEVHDDEYEKFLVLEGSCIITIEDESHDMVPGSVLVIPLHKKHFVKVTSVIPCKIILQRIAA